MLLQVLATEGIVGTGVGVSVRVTSTNGVPVITGVRGSVSITVGSPVITAPAAVVGSLKFTNGLVVPEGMTAEVGTALPIGVIVAAGMVVSTVAVGLLVCTGVFSAGEDVQPALNTSAIRTITQIPIGIILGFMVVSTDTINITAPGMCPVTAPPDAIDSLRCHRYCIKEYDGL
jgi:hypothetical protein